MTPGQPTPARRLTGSGDPVTVFAPGLGQSIPMTRPFGSGVVGTKVFFEFSDPGLLDADRMALELAGVADPVNATRAVGASRGAAAVWTQLAREPRRFERVVLALPAWPPPSEVRPPLRDVGPVLIIGNEGDPLHPAEVARVVAACFPDPQLHILPGGELLTDHRAEVRMLISTFLNAPSPSQHGPTAGPA